MTQHTALDRFADGVCHLSRVYRAPLDHIVRAERASNPLRFILAFQDLRFLIHCRNYMLDGGWEFDGFTWRHPDGRAYQGSLPIPKSSLAFRSDGDWRDKCHKMLEASDRAH